MLNVFFALILHELEYALIIHEQFGELDTEIPEK